MSQTVRFRFTQKRLAELSTEKPRAWVYDDQVQALACMVTQSGSKSFYVSKLHAGRKHQVRIGAVAEVPIPKARQLALSILKDLLDGKDPRGARGTRQQRLELRQVFEQYCEFVAAHRRPSTLVSYQWMWEKHVRQWAGARPLSSIRRRDVGNLHVRLGKEHGHYLANRVLGLLRAAINKAIRENELDMPNPAAGIYMFKERSRTRRLKPDELPQFFQAVLAEPSDGIRDYVLLSLYTGARKANVLAMRWDQLDMQAGVWTIPHGEAKSGVELQVVLPQAAQEILHQRHASQSGPWVFPGKAPSGHLEQPESGWRRILKRAGLENLRIHDLRRSLASYQLDTGAPLEVIQKTLGHGNRAATEVYARMALDPVRQSLEKAVQAIQQHAAVKE